METPIYLIAGLGNPGPEYADNRHNVGFRCLDRLAETHRLAFRRRQKRAQVTSGRIQGHRVVLVKPQTFMNKSGESVARLAQFYKVDLARLMVVYDDLDLPPGTIRLRPSGGSGGHRGVRSIIHQLGSQEFPRLRIGIGRPPGRMDPADYVLQDVSGEEAILFDRVLDRAVDAIEIWLDEGIRQAMDEHNQSPGDGG